MKAITENVKRNVLKEQFIPDHLFLYLIRGEVDFFDGNDRYTFRAGQCCIARRNHLIKFILNGEMVEFEPVMFCFDGDFLHGFQQKHKIQTSEFTSERGIIRLEKAELTDSFIRSIGPYYKAPMELDEAFEDLKYEELLLILLKIMPELSGLFFDFKIPQKINLESYMNRNFRFNVSLERFAFLTGRSLSSFKRDFQEVFHETPSRWLVRRRLKEAYVMIKEERRQPSEIYLDLGFESLSHFSVAFKKAFGVIPTSLKLR